MFNRDKNIALTFVNYNYAFSNFYENYKNQCLVISDKTKINELKEVRKLISTFIYEYDYTIKNTKQRLLYRAKLSDIKREMDQDEEISKIFHKDFSIVTNKIEYHRKYYKYFLLYLEVLGKFVSELTATFMPNTNIQKKLLRFSNNQSFFEQFTQHKKILMEALSEFSIKEFAKGYNKLITFYYAYSLFINTEDRILLDKLFSVILSMYLTRDNLNLLNNESLTISKQKSLYEIELRLHNALLYCNSKMNQSFSNYDVLPKLQTKVYVDRTLI